MSKNTANQKPEKSLHTFSIQRVVILSAFLPLLARATFIGAKVELFACAPVIVSVENKKDIINMADGIENLGNFVIHS